jgi:hypothetical protein
VKKAVIYTLGSLFLFCLFRELNALKVLFVLCGLGAVYGISLIPAKGIMALKYPVILLSFAATAGFLLAPRLVNGYPIQALVVGLSFFSVTFYLVTMDEKGSEAHKEAAALSVLFLTSAFNLAMIARPLYILPLSLAVLLFLFIIGRGRAMLFIAAYTAAIMVAVLYKRITMFGPGLGVSDVYRYLLLAAALLMLLFSFSGAVRKGNALKILGFFGFLYLSIDIIMVLGFRFSGGLLYQPLTLLCLVSPLLGFMITAEREKV